MGDDRHGRSPRPGGRAPWERYPTEESPEMDGPRESRRPRQPEPPANPGPLTVQDLVDRVDSERTVRRREGDAPRHGVPDGPPPERAPRPPAPGPRPPAEQRPRPEQQSPEGPSAARPNRPHAPPQRPSAPAPGRPPTGSTPAAQPGPADGRPAGPPPQRPDRPQPPAVRNQPTAPQQRPGPDQPGPGRRPVGEMPPGPNASRPPTGNRAAVPPPAKPAPDPSKRPPTGQRPAAQPIESGDPTTVVPQQPDPARAGLRPGREAAPKRSRQSSSTPRRGKTAKAAAVSATEPPKQSPISSIRSTRTMPGSAAGPIPPAGRPPDRPPRKLSAGLNDGSPPKADATGGCGSPAVLRWPSSPSSRC